MKGHPTRAALGLRLSNHNIDPNLLPRNGRPPSLEALNMLHDEINAKWREEISACMAAIEISSRICQNYAYLADDAGLNYQILRIAAHLRACVEHNIDLQARKREGGHQ